MKISRNDFETAIDDRILERGVLYYKSGAVLDVFEVADNEYEATVSGTKEYLVQLEVVDDVVHSFFCDCPFNYGPVCKHVVAVLYCLWSNDADTGTDRRIKKRKSDFQQVQEVLAAIPHQDLITFVQRTCKKDKKFRNHFMVCFDGINQEVSKEFYQKRIHSIIQSYVGAKGWISWEDVSEVIVALDPFEEKINGFLEKKEYDSVFCITTALLEEMYAALDYMVQGNDEPYTMLETLLAVLVRLTGEEISEEFKCTLFRYALQKFKEGVFSDWDSHLVFLAIACTLVNNAIDAEFVLNTIDASVKRDDCSEKIAVFELDIITRFKSDAETQRYIDKHVSNSEIRTQEIEKAIGVANFERAITLAKDGIEQDKNERQGWEGNWYELLLKIAKIQHDKPRIIEYARYRFINSFHSSENHYQILKDTIDSTEWSSFLEELIKEVTPKKSWTYSKLVRKNLHQ